MRFQKKYCGLTKKLKREELSELNNYYDCFVFGGDQIWCLDNAKVDDTYFGDFVKERSKKISYSPSFGITQLPEESKKRVASLLGEFKSLSVREKSGQAIVFEMLGYYPKLVVDPVFLLKETSYNELIKEYEGPKYCLCYVRERQFGNMMKMATDIAKRNDFSVLSLAGTSLNGKRIPIIGPEVWLGLIKGAEVILTNSFHAVCFAIIFHKDFYVEANANSTRLINILEMFELQDRLLPLQKTQSKPIDWVKVDSILEEHRNESIAYLNQALFD